MMTFGIGKRNCAGQALAIRSLNLTFSKLLLRYKFELPAHLNVNVEIKREFQATFQINPRIDLKVSRL
jgi:cytochrome P450